MCFVDKYVIEYIDRIAGQFVIGALRLKCTLGWVFVLSIKIAICYVAMLKYLIYVGFLVAKSDMKDSYHVLGKRQ